MATALLATSTAGAKRTAGYDLDREIAWARAKWPAELRDVQFRSPLPRLLAWVPVGKSIDAYVYSPEHACEHVELSRGEDRNGRRAAASPALVAKVHIRVSTDGRETRRQFELLWFDDQLTQDGDWSEVETMSPNGRWRRSEAGGTGSGGRSYGVLSYADGEVARFGGEPLSVHLTCGEACEPLSGASDEQRPRHDCDGLSVDVAGVAAGLVAPPVDRTATCREPRPSYFDPLRERVDELWQRASPWRPRKLQRSEIPSLHRSRTDCLRVHAPALRDGEGESDGVETTETRIEPP